MRRPIAGLALACLAAGWLSLAPPPPDRTLPSQPPAPRDRTVYLGGGLSDEGVIVFTAAIAAAGRGDVVLLDGPKAGPYLKHFLDAYQPNRIIPVGSFAGGAAALAHRLGHPIAPIIAWNDGLPARLLDTLFPQAPRIVLCPAEPRALLLQSACLAGALHAPLVVTHGAGDKASALANRLAGWGTREIYAAGAAAGRVAGVESVQVTPLADASAVAARYVSESLRSKSIRTLVVANPADVTSGLAAMSSLAPWLALEHHAALLLTEARGGDVTRVVRAADTLGADTLILAAGLKAIPMEQRPNPARGKDADIPMEPLTPIGDEPFSFATGRLFHEDPAVVTLMAARQQLLGKDHAGPRKALVVSNPGGGLPLLETFSRNTARELRNRGYQTTGLFEEEVTKEQVRRLVPAQDIFLWEGHYKTLVDEYGLPKWDEPLAPGLVFLQSCLALNEAEAQPLLQRGAVAVVGSPSRMYSGSGGAFTLAFFDAMLYDGQSLGGALRQAKNFLLAYSMLKEQRLADQAKLGGANLRSAWAFTLWGDPTLTLPRPPLPANVLPAVRPELHGRTVVFILPETFYDMVTTEKYEAQMLPNSRLAGLLTTDKSHEAKRRFVPFLFAEIPLPTAPVGHKLWVRCRLPERHWVFTYDPRRRCAYLLVTPRPRDEREIRFHINWED